jgi:putative acetyltransferase
MIEIFKVNTSENIQTIRSLFWEYAQSLDADLCFQDFDREVSSLPGCYSSPTGALLLATYAEQPAGCVALRPMEKGICEMKRLYVRPEYRRYGIGQCLISAIIKEAEAIGYEKMRLDTLPIMKEAQALYKKNGFKRIDAYRPNPVEGTVYMELDLTRTS